jgi:hypothetical protein
MRLAGFEAAGAWGSRRLGFLVSSAGGPGIVPCLRSKKKDVKSGKCKVGKPLGCDAPSGFLCYPVQAFMRSLTGLADSSAPKCGAVFVSTPQNGLSSPREWKRCRIATWAAPEGCTASLAQ